MPPSSDPDTFRRGLMSSSSSPEPPAELLSSKNRGHRSFGRLGRMLAEYPWLAIVFMVAVSGALSSGWFRDNLVNKKLFESLLLRPRTRLLRETERWNERENDGYASTNEATNGQATRGGKNVLTRKNMAQVYRFFRDARVPEMEISHRGVTYTAPDVLRYGGSQPYRFTVLDCYQEGAYDYRGEDLTDLTDAATANLLVGIVDELLAPFGQRTPSITPYSWCLYARLGVAYAPVTQLDPAQFGTCRQFVDDLYYADFADPLLDAYDFHRFMAYDLLKSEPSDSYAFGCKRPFIDEPAGRCHEVVTCCGLSTLYTTCAKCDIDGVALEDCLVDEDAVFYDPSANATALAVSVGGTCASIAEILQVNNDDTSFPSVNPDYDASYAAETPACAAFDFWPVSTTYGALFIGAASAVAENTTFDDCTERKARFDQDDDVISEDDDDARSSSKIAPYVEAALKRHFCVLGGVLNDGCPTTLTAPDFDWDFRLQLASDESMAKTALGHECAQWDGGPAGLGLFQYVKTDIILGDQDYLYAEAMQTVQVSQGYKAVRNTVEARTGETLRDNDVEDARIEFLVKYGKVLHGRHDSGSMIFGTYLSEDGELAIARSSVPETLLITFAYCLIALYTIIVLGLGASAPTSWRTALLHCSLALGGLVGIVIGLAGGVGVALYLGNDFNAISVQVLPFVLLGLGINDLFIVSYCYLRELRRLVALKIDPADDKRAAADLVAVVTVDAGATITLTTCANAFVFLVAGAFVRMRLVATFCFLAACGLIGTWLSTVIAYPAVLSLHARAALAVARRERALFQENEEKNDDSVDEEATPRARPDDPAAAAALENENDDFPSSPKSPRKLKRAQWVDAYASFLTVNVVSRWAALLLGSAAIVAICVVGMPQIRLDFPIFSMFPRNSSPAIFWQTKRDHLTTNFFAMKTDASDWPRKHPLYASVADPRRYSLISEVENSKKTDTNQDTWYHVFIQYMLPCGTGSFLDDEDLSEAEVRQACDSSSFYGGLTSPLNYSLYNPRCSNDDPLLTDGYFCGPRANAGFFGPSQHALADRKAELFASQNDTSSSSSSDGAAPLLASPEIPVCSAWPVQYFLCDGGEPCFGAAELTPGLAEQVRNSETVVLGLHPEYFYECFDYFLNADAANSFRSPNFNCVNTDDPEDYSPCTAVPAGSRRGWRGGGPKNDGDMDHTSATIWAFNLRTGENWLRLISSVRSHVNNFKVNTRLNAYPGSSFWVFWYQYVFIEDTLTKAAGVSISGIWLLAFLFFVFARPPQPTSFLVRLGEAVTLAAFMTGSVVLFVLTFISLMGIADLWFNAFTLASVITSLGIAVEFVAHTSMGYLVSVGTAAERARKAANEYVLPIFDGGFTTFLGVAPLAFSVLVYINLYYFRLYAIMVAVGIIFGVFIYPALLATCGRDNTPQDHEHISKKTLFKLDDDDDDDDDLIKQKAIELTAVAKAHDDDDDDQDEEDKDPEEGKNVDSSLVQPDDDAPVATADV